jgi:hypothetical protein
VIRVGRRQFIGLGLGAAAGALGMASVSRWPHRSLGAGDVIVFDRRFERAAGLATRMAGGRSLRAIAGDATELALWLQSRARLGRRACVRGVTTESVPFCLRQIAPRASLAIERIDHDLFSWAVRLPG